VCECGAQGRNLMAPYLPPSASGSPYSEGGALYALGLIHANHGQAIRAFLLDSLRGTSHEARGLARSLPWRPRPASRRACRGAALE